MWICRFFLISIIDSTHIKANANKKKGHKITAQKAARIYEKELTEENKCRTENFKR